MSIEYVDCFENVLSTLKIFKACIICNHRLQVWAGENNLETLTNILGGEANIAEKIFDFLS